MDPNKDPEPGQAGGGDAQAGKGSSPKPPPWQVPKPELRPDLLNEPVATVDPFAQDREKEAKEGAARKKRSQRRTVVVGLGVTALLAGTITAVVASNQDDPEYAQVCFNDETGERVEDRSCDSSAGRSGGIYAWYFYSRGATVPSVGQNRSTAPNYTRTVPSGAKAATGYKSSGGTVDRGGFGTSAKSGGTKVGG
ncbi:Tat pathway signal protein [Arthrobacter sp. ZBG10]|uniref:hypothetical protein n=1 Tax=Micrococcaceae TaxID=1268 RepID=UPI000680DDC9|nr:MULTISPECIES: hypothetical protein [Micrococcaceae]KNH17663.1 Tat pathway signal protein [Arthrobacter sp. ZBG10]